MRKYKIAILTQAPLGTNYGNTLQAFALQKFLNNHQQDVTVLDRVKSEIYDVTHWSLSNLKNEILNFIDKKNRLTPRTFNQIFKQHFQFVYENVRLSERLHNSLELENHFKNNAYTMVIVGSDQTWRPQYSPNIYNYFLDFLADNHSIKKVAYASSFGTDQWEFTDEETKKCAQLLQQFNAVSVREESGVALCKQFLNVEAQWVLDPTFLLSKEDYVQLISQKQLPKRSGLYSYILDENDAIEEVINQVGTLLNLEHFTNQPKWRRNDKTGKTLEDLQYPTVEGWLKGFHDADFIVTNSFHGTVFAIIFNKPFLTIINNLRGAARFYSLLEQFGLENRIITIADTSMIPEIVNCTLDFSEVNIKLNELKKISSKFLLDILS